MARHHEKILAAVEARRVPLSALRPHLLAEPGVKLLRTKTRGRGRQRERIDLLRYTRPGQRRASCYVTVTWRRGRRSWSPESWYTRTEAEVQYRYWGSIPSWFKEPRLLEETEG